MTTWGIHTSAETAKSGIEAGAKAAKSTVRAARKALADRLDIGHSQASSSLDGAKGRAEDALKAAEGALLGVLDSMAARGRRTVRDGERQVYQAGARLLPRRRAAPPFGTALAGLGAGFLIYALLAPREAKLAASATGAKRPA